MSVQSDELNQLLELVRAKHSVLRLELKIKEEQVEALERGKFIPKSQTKTWPKFKQALQKLKDLSL